MRIEEKLYENIKKITLTNYNGILQEDSQEYLIPIEGVYAMLEDLEYHVRMLQELIEQKEKYYQDNYRRINPAEMYGVDDSDFM